MHERKQIQIASGTNAIAIFFFVRLTVQYLRLKLNLVLSCHISRTIAPGFLDNDLFRIQTLQHVMKMTRTWDSTMSMIPRGGDTIWGGLDWSPEEGYHPSQRKHSNNNTQLKDHETNQTNFVNYGRMISFGRDVAEAHSPEIQMTDFRVSLF